MSKLQSFPSEISSFFSPIEHPKFPILNVPQEFADSRGIILNIVDGQLGDVAIIHSTKGAIRANHHHKLDWHITYLLEGKVSYFYSEAENTKESEVSETELNKGDLLLTPKMTWHKFKFIENSIMVVVSGLSRKKDLYDLDTVPWQIR